MSKRFLVEISTEVMIELSDGVIDAVNDEWRKTLYNLQTPEEIAEHIAYNMVVNDARLSQLDGWADRDDQEAEILLSPDWNVRCITTEVSCL